MNFYATSLGNMQLLVLAFVLLCFCAFVLLCFCAFVLLCFCAFVFVCANEKETQGAQDVLPQWKFLCRTIGNFSDKGNNYL